MIYTDLARKKNKFGQCPANGPKIGPRVFVVSIEKSVPQGDTTKSTVLNAYLCFIVALARNSSAVKTDMAS